MNLDGFVVSETPDAFKRCHKIGAKNLRTLLYMRAVVAKRHNKVLKPFADALIELGKPKKVVTVAVMRKLLHYIFAVLKKGNYNYP